MNSIMTCLQPNDGHPGVEIAWAADCREAFNQGVKLAQTWLDNARSEWLWTVMIAERDLLPCPIERRIRGGIPESDTSEDKHQESTRNAN